jgi:hypothetical protein
MKLFSFTRKPGVALPIHRWSNQLANPLLWLGDQYEFNVFQ